MTRISGSEKNSNPHPSCIKFLVVDDQIPARKMLCQIVSGNPLWSVIGEASNGAEAVAQLEQKPDAVLMDIVMPLMDGLEATRQIKLLAPDTFVILTTAYKNREFRTRSFKAGADGFLLKDDLTTEALQSVLSNSRNTGKKGENGDG